MNELQVGLVALGVVLIAAVLGVNWWQDHKARRHVRRHFGNLGGGGGDGDDNTDPLGEISHRAATGRREPALGSKNAATAVVAVLNSHADPEANPDADAAPQEPAAPAIDPACEVVIDLAFAEPVAGARLKPELRRLHEVGGKPVRVFVCTAPHSADTESDTNGDWHTRVHDDAHYAALQLVLLLANRSGPVGAIDWSRLWQHAERLAEQFDATLEGPEQEAVLDQARRLDQFCAAADVQVGLNLVAARGLPVATVLALARDLGFVLVDGRLLWLSEDGLTRFALAPDEGEDGFDERGSLSRLTLLLDVPHSPADEHAFGRMAQLGAELATRLDAQLLDDQGQPLTEAGVAAIDGELAAIYARLASADMQAGSTRAKRVFA